jgi:energy-coupling factor transporter transmembrane protein EcfT
MHHLIPTPWRILVIVVLVILAVIPMLKILQRMGYSRWWVIVGVISPLNIIGLWYLAYAGWPTEIPKNSK